MRALLAALALIGMASVGSAKVPDARRVADLAAEAMRETKARGLGVAVIEDGKIASVQAFGERNAKGEPLTLDTVMYGASLTKAVFAYTIMQLVEEGRVDLDRGAELEHVAGHRRVELDGRPVGMDHVSESFAQVLQRLPK